MLSWPHRTSANIINTCFMLLETCTKCSYFTEENIPPGAQRLAFEVKYEYIVHQPRIYRGPGFCAFATFQTSGDWSVKYRFGPLQELGLTTLVPVWETIFVFTFLTNWLHIFIFFLYFDGFRICELVTFMGTCNMNRPTDVCKFKSSHKDMSRPVGRFQESFYSKSRTFSCWC